MEVLCQVRSATRDEDLRAVLEQLPPATSRPYLCKLAKLRRLIDGSQAYAACSMSAVILGDVHLVSRWLQQAAGKEHVLCYVQAVEAILAVLKHAYPLLPRPARERYQKAWRQVFAAARQSYDGFSAAARQEAAQFHAAKLKALGASMRAMPVGDQDRCLLMCLLRLGGRLNDGLIARMGSLAVYDARTDAECEAPGGELLEDFVFVASEADHTYLAFRDAAEDELGQEADPIQIRALLPEELAAEIKASLDLRPRSHLFVQRGGRAYALLPSFQKRLRAALKAALQASGQAAVSLSDLLAIARSKDPAIEAELRRVHIEAP
ncbi:hypothetical protein COO60DRAFT_1465405 [Scenedesmus sp. NREL 46B-D3]|nr:hypothetical protein COO60DRAFT_1465405 [Scenedesmus sp. NREL 46B-D3]